MIHWCCAAVSSSPAVSGENWKFAIRRRPPLQRRLHLCPQSANLTIQSINSARIETVADSQPQNHPQIAPAASQTLSKNAQKRLLKQQRYEAKKLERKAQIKEQKKREAERKRKEWQEKLATAGSEEEREKIIEHGKSIRKQRMDKWFNDRRTKFEKLLEARVHGQKLVIDLEFYPLMNSNELNSLIQQIAFSYAMNARSVFPAHIWLTGCHGELQDQFLQITGYENWVIEKENQSYTEVFHDQKHDLVYLTADSENVLEDIDPKAIYIIGGLVDRNRRKGITMKKAAEQGIKTARLPIGTYLNMSRSQVLTVNQVVQILLKFLETRDWKDSFFQVIPHRKKFEFAFAPSNQNKEEEDCGKE